LLMLMLVEYWLSNVVFLDILLNLPVLLEQWLVGELDGSGIFDVHDVRIELAHFVSH
jgi:hypothetical protein